MNTPGLHVATRIELSKKERWRRIHTTWNHLYVIWKIYKSLCIVHSYAMSKGKLRVTVISQKGGSHGSAGDTGFPCPSSSSQRKGKPKNGRREGSKEERDPMETRQNMEIWQSTWEGWPWKEGRDMPPFGGKKREGHFWREELPNRQAIFLSSRRSSFTIVKKWTPKLFFFPGRKWWSGWPLPVLLHTVLNYIWPLCLVFSLACPPFLWNFSQRLLRKYTGFSWKAQLPSLTAQAEEGLQLYEWFWEIVTNGAPAGCRALFCVLGNKTRSPVSGSLHSVGRNRKYISKVGLR